MLNFGAEHIYLRALEPEDLSFLEEIENDEELWHLSSTQTPFSKNILKKYIENSHRTIYDTEQLRLVICCREKNVQLGFIDIFEFSAKHKRAGLGIVLQQKYRGKGYAYQAIKAVLHYGFKHLDLHQFYAYVETENLKSIKLFETCEFVKTGERKDWNYHHKQFHTEAIFQIFNNVY
jgi:diamine N-acetyltransferase